MNERPLVEQLGSGDESPARRYRRIFVGRRFEHLQRVDEALTLNAHHLTGGHATVLEDHIGRVRAALTAAEAANMRAMDAHGNAATPTGRIGHATRLECATAAVMETRAITATG